MNVPHCAPPPSCTQPPGPSRQRRTIGITDSTPPLLLNSGSALVLGQELVHRFQLCGSNNLSILDDPTAGKLDTERKGRMLRLPHPFLERLSGCLDSEARPVARAGRLQLTLCELALRHDLSNEQSRH